MVQENSGSKNAKMSHNCLCMARLWLIAFMPSLHVSIVLIFSTMSRGWGKKTENALPPGERTCRRFPLVSPTGDNGPERGMQSWMSILLSQAQVSVWGDVSKAETCGNTCLEFGCWMFLGYLILSCRLPSVWGAFPSPHRIILSPRTTFVVLHEQLSLWDREGDCSSGIRAEVEVWEGWYTRCLRELEAVSRTEGHLEAHGGGSKLWWILVSPICLQNIFSLWYSTAHPVLISLALGPLGQTSWAWFLS